MSDRQESWEDLLRYVQANKNSHFCHLDTHDILYAAQRIEELQALREAAHQYKSATEVAMSIYPFKVDGTKLAAALEVDDE